MQQFDPGPGTPDFWGAPADSLTVPPLDQVAATIAAAGGQAAGFNSALFTLNEGVAI